MADLDRTHDEKRERWISAGGALWALNRPYVVIVLDEDSTVVALHYGNRSSDPVFWISVKVPRPLDWPFVKWSNRQWDKAVARQEAAMSDENVERLIGTVTSKWSWGSGERCPSTTSNQPATNKGDHL